jgi:hypothetical protein
MDHQRTDKPPSVVPDFSGFAKSILSLLGFAYLFGFLIVNAHLAKYGIVETNPVRAQFLAAGGIFIALTAAVWTTVLRDMVRGDEATTARYENLVARGIPADAARRLARFGSFAEPLLGIAGTQVLAASYLLSKVDLKELLFVSFLVLLLPVGMASMLARREEPPARRIVWGAVAIVGTIAYLTAVIVLGSNEERFLLLSLLLPALGGVPYRQWWAPIEATHERVLAWAAMSLILSAGLFGSTVYGAVRPAIGGGRPETVMLILKHEASPQLQVLLSIEKGISAPVRLIVQSDSELAVHVGESDAAEKTIRIARSEVSAIVRRQQ